MKRRTATAGIIVVVALVAALSIYLSQTTSSPTTVEPISAHYLSFNSVASKIYLLGAATSYGNANETLIAANGAVIQKGNPLFIVTLTLRNDYTSDEPAPALPNQGQTSPADGTAYLYLTAQLHNKNGVVNATDVSVSDFSIPAIQGTGCVLASGQTSPVNIYMATTHTDISKCEINLVALGDSIPT
jgi:hypothetical protein